MEPPSPTLLNLVFFWSLSLRQGFDVRCLRHCLPRVWARAMEAVDELLALVVIG